jgi:uncharacterized repeat protein (TIGR03803 family)
VVFKLDPSGHETVLYTFTGGVDGGRPYAGVIIDSAGNLYGTTAGGGTTGVGAVFKVDVTGHETVLYGFPGTDGSGPQADVIQDSAGNLYGTTCCGGSTGAGVVYKIDTTGHETILYNFTGGDDGANPYAGVIMDSAGNLYGTAAGGGSSGTGVVYKLDATGHETVLYSFAGPSGCFGCPNASGSFPYSGVIMDSAGNLYGTTQYGGASGWGVVYKLDANGHETVLHNFTFGTDGGASVAGVIMDSAGNLYGTTQYGGVSFGGAVYKLNVATGQFTVLHNFTFGPDGGGSEAGLILDSAGNLYGTTASGGGPGCCPGQPGVVFKVNPAGVETVLYTFGGGADGNTPEGGVISDPAGNLYGTTLYGGSGSGVVFELFPSGQETVLYTFTGGADGGGPVTGVILDSAGNLYGTTAGGGQAAAGVVYKITPGATAQTFSDGPPVLQQWPSTNRSTNPLCSLPLPPHKMACPSNVPSKEKWKRGVTTN